MVKMLKTLEGMTFVDLFAGIGGFHLAFESLGAKCVYASELDRTARQIYEKNFRMVPDGDITKISAMDIPDHNILCAGFPCQAFSISGKKKGFEDSRGTLFFEVARIVNIKHPDIVVLENVRNFAMHDHGHTMKVVRDVMEALGYTVYAKVLNASDYGVPQKRERIYIVCFKRDVPFAFPEPFKLEKHVEDCLIDEKLVQHLYVDRKITWNGVEEKYSNKPLRLGIVEQGRQGERIYSTKGTAITLSAFGGGVFAKTGGYKIGNKARRLHSRECARLMGFPDSFQLPENAYKYLGNSVVVDVLQYIGENIGKAM